MIECTKSQKCDGCVICKAQCIYISKKHCVKYIKLKGKCEDCEDLPPKYNSNYKFNLFFKDFYN